MDSSNYAGIELSKALAGSGFKLVPDVVVNGGGSGSSDGGNSLVSVLLANLIRDGRGKRTDSRHATRWGSMEFDPTFRARYHWGSTSQTSPVWASSAVGSAHEWHS